MKPKVVFIIAMIALTIAFAALSEAENGTIGNVFNSTFYGGNFLGNITNSTINLYNITNDNATINPYHLNATNLSGKIPSASVPADICSPDSPKQVSRWDGTAFVCDPDTGGGGGITSISQGNGIILTPNPITSTGSISVNSTVAYITNITTEEWVEGGDGQKNFTMAVAFRPNSTRVWINGIKKRHTFDYNETITTNSVNITSALVGGDTIEIEYVEV